jgi:hypothetical protein
VPHSSISSCIIFVKHPQQVRCVKTFRLEWNSWPIACVFYKVIWCIFWILDPSVPCMNLVLQLILCRHLESWGRWSRSTQMGTCVSVSMVRLGPSTHFVCSLSQVRPLSSATPWMPTQGKNMPVSDDSSTLGFTAP